jgi:PAS domain S-box-containing protein
MAIPPTLSPPHLGDETVRRSEERFRSLVWASSPIVWTTNPVGEVVENVPGWTAFTGQTLEQSAGKGWLHAIHPNDLERAIHVWRTAAAAKTEFRSEYRLRRHDGVYRHMVALGVPVLEADGSIREWVGTCTDITEQRRAEQRKAGQARVLELLAKGEGIEKVLTALVESIEEQCDRVAGSVLLLDADGEHVHCKAAPHLPAAFCRELDGLSIGPEAGSCGSAIYHCAAVVTDDISRDPRWAKYRELAARFKLKACWSQPIFSMEGRVLGSFALYPQVCREPKGAEKNLIESAAHLAGVAIDHDRARAALHQAKEGAEAANRAKDDFLATVSHELRTPIGAVLLWSKLLKAGTLDPKQSREAVERIVQCAQEQARLVNDLLDVTHILHGTMAADSKQIDLGEVVEAGAEEERMHADAKGVRLEVKAVPTPASGDAIRLRQLVSNLVANAIKFTPAGGRVDVRLTQQNGQARLEVTDTGEGISAEYLPHLFSRFSQADSSITRRHGGMGLGLSIVKSIAELHGGSVGARSEGEGRGAAFTVTLPVSE